MQHKLDTKEKFYVITPQIGILTANVAAELATDVMLISEKSPHNVILNCSTIDKANDDALHLLAENLKEKMYENNRSFVICCLSDNIANQVATLELEEALNVTPTESEAWDIVQMDEIEREFLNGFDEE